MTCFFSLAWVCVADVVVGMASKQVETRIANPFVFLNWFPDWELGKGQVEIFRQIVSSRLFYLSCHSRCLIKVFVFDSKLLMLCLLHWSHEIAFYLPFFIKWRLFGDLSQVKLMHPLSALPASFVGANNHSEFTSNCVGLAENVKVIVFFVLDTSGLPELWIKLNLRTLPSANSAFCIIWWVHYSRLSLAWVTILFLLACFLSTRSSPAMTCSRRSACTWDASTLTFVFSFTFLPKPVRYYTVCWFIKPKIYF